MYILLISVFTYVFDLFILLSYMNNILGKHKNNIPTFIFYLSYMVMEIILFINEIFTANLNNEKSLIITTFISFITTFALSFFYNANLPTRIFSSVSFQVLATFGEYAFTCIMGKINPEIFNFSTKELSVIMNLGSKVFLFFFTLTISRMFVHTFPKGISYNLLILTTPLVTLTIMFFTPLRDINHGINRTFFTCLYFCLALLNITNYIFINHTYRQTTELFRLKQADTLIHFQQEKYKQLSCAYKSNRSLIHDTKKHYFIIKKYLENKEYEKLNAYLDISLCDMENNYSEINTGNLVIDSFVTNYKNICIENRINFITDLSVDYNRIPISDYELCIILGNILDNAINACEHNSSVNNYIKLTITSNDNDIFYIHTENTYNIAQKKYNSTNDNELLLSEHGYGLKNIKKIVENNHGIINVYSEDLFIVDIVLPITEIDKRILNPPVS